MRDTQVNTFSGGMNMDIGKSMLPNNAYPYAENVRLVSDKSSENNEIENIKGNLMKFAFDSIPTVYEIRYIGESSGTVSFLGTMVRQGKSITLNYSFTYLNEVDLYEKVSTYLLTKGLIVGHDNDHITVTSQGITQLSFTLNTHNWSVTNIYAGYKALNPVRYCGHVIIRDECYVFTTAENANASQIWKMTSDFSGATLIYNNKLNFDTDYIIEGIGYYNTDINKKGYFIDGKNRLRQFNAGDANLLCRDPYSFEIIDKVSLTKPTVTGLGAGNLMCGVIQYSYQLYHLNGAQTKFSDPSYMVKLSDKSLILANNRNFNGGDKGTTSGKSCKVKITGIDTSFDYIRVVSLFWDSLQGIPVITIVDERGIPESGEIEIEDGGFDNLGTYTLDEYTSIGSTLFVPQTIEQKNNLLVVGNITEEYFDVEYDARAYRWKLDGSWKALVKDASGTQTLISTSDALTWDEQHDCIQDKITQQTYKYNSTTGNLGGMGPNVGYEFAIKSIPLNDNADYNTFKTSVAPQYWSSFYLQATDNTYYPDYSSAVNGQFIGYQRDEVYRFGVVFKDEFGRQSFVKWIADIKIPSVRELDQRVTYSTGTVNKYDYSITFEGTGSLSGTYANIVYPVFTLYDIPINPNTGLAYDYEIVRVKREDKDKSIVCQGILLPSRSEDDEWIPYPIMLLNGIDIYSNRNWLISPDPIIGENNGGNDLFVSDCYVDLLYRAEPYKVLLNGESKWTCSTIKTNTLYNDGLTHQVISHAYAKNGDSFGLDNNALSDKFNNRYMSAALTGGNDNTSSGQKVAMVISNINPSTFSSIFVYHVNIYKNNVSQYGGASYYDRINNEYVQCAKFQIPGTSSYAVFGGDTYIEYFDYLNCYLNAGNNDFSDFRFENIYIPCETTIPLHYRTDYPFHTAKGNPTVNNYYLQEFAGFYTDGSETYTQDKDLYVFNTVYKKENDVIKYFPRPLNFVESKVYDCRELVSERKILNEETDSWLQFLPQNFLDLSPQYGPIVQMINHHNYFTVLQQKAIGVTSIDERSIIPDNNPSAIVLGTGGVLVRHDYVSTQTGTKHKHSVKSTPDGVYYYDDINKSIQLLNSGSVSDIKGIRDYVLNASTQTVVSYYKKVNREVVFVFTDSAVAYNELKKAFTCVYTSVSPYYIEMDANVLSISRSDVDYVYHEGMGVYNEFYGVNHPSKIRLLINKQFPVSKIYDSCMCYFKSLDDDINQLTDFFTSIQCWNDYQNSDKLTFIFKESMTQQLNDPMGLAGQHNIFFNKKNRTCSFFIPRNVVSKDIQDNPNIFTDINHDREFKERLRDKYLIIELEYAGSNHINFPEIITNFRYVYE